MRLKRIFCLILVTLCLLWASKAQRIYRPNSVLATGNWYKMGVSSPGIYKIDIAFLNSLGINTSGLASNAIRLYGNSGRMLSESNSGMWVDDLEENAIWVVDGGDGILNGTDHILFYANGPDHWVKDSVNKKFIHHKNIYSDTAFYFLTIGGIGKRISTQQNTPVPNLTVTTFNERFFHELDSVNLLASGKEWLGEEFMDAPGKTLSRTFNVSLPGLIIGQPMILVSNCVARSVGNPSRFDVRINNQLVQQVNVPATGGGFYDLFARQAQQEANTNITQDNLSVNYTFVPGAFNAQGWLNFFEIHARRNLSLGNSGQTMFRDWNSVGNNIAEFNIANTTGNSLAWDVTDPLNPFALSTVFSGGILKFSNGTEQLREYIVFNSASAMLPKPFGSISNQNLHNISPSDYLVITHNSMLPQAERLAAFHRIKNNLRVSVTTTDKIFNEFSSGIPDPTAIRDFVKMYYDVAVNPADRPKYLLFFGDASFDYKDRISGNTNFVPGYQSPASLDPLSTYMSDDFFGFLDDNEDINSTLVSNLLDVGIGRIPAKNIAEAKNYVDKVEAYYSKESLGPWRNQVTFVADDEDNNLHLEDAEIVTATSFATNPLFNIQKIYLDAYPQQSNASGNRYPQVNDVINSKIFNGTLIWNYSGHGGARRLAEEVILDQEIVNSWNNPNRLPVFVTSTCDFAPYDDPRTASLGENLLLRPQTGGIALMTTTRLVFSFSNRIMNNNYMQMLLQPDATGKYKNLGEAVMTAKNYTYQTSGDVVNNRKFTLLGDPALRPAFPQFRISTTKINDILITANPDTLSAGEKIVIEGEVTDFNSVSLSGFNGTVYPVVFDKPIFQQTLGNDPGSPVTPFQTQSVILFKGKATVTNGRFRFEFRVPNDINYQFGNGRISYYAEDGDKDGSDHFNGFIVGGSSGLVLNDREGPVIKAWLNDEKFVNGSITNQNPVLILKLFDSSGINTTSTGIGHDISVTIDNDNSRVFILNEFYEADLDNYQQGMVRFQLPVFEAGHHTLKIKAWDALNNSSENVLDFLVMNDEELTISHVLNYPNPFTTKTNFWFEHNKPGLDMQVQVQIYSLTGRIIKTLQQTINTPGHRFCELEWDGRDEYGDKVARGVYFYRLKVTAPGLKPRSVFEKIVVF